MADPKPNKAAADQPAPADTRDASPDTDDSTQSDGGKAQLQSVYDKIQEQGYVGEVPDDTPNDNYTLRTPQDAPVPETQRVHPNKQNKGDDNTGDAKPASK